MLNIPEKCEKCGAPLYQNDRSRSLICEYCGELYKDERNERYDYKYVEEVIQEEANDLWKEGNTNELKNWNGEYDAYEENLEEVKYINEENRIRRNIETQRQKGIDNFTSFIFAILLLSLVIIFFAFV